MAKYRTCHTLHSSFNPLDMVQTYLCPDRKICTLCVVAVVYYATIISLTIKILTQYLVLIIIIIIIIIIVIIIMLILKFMILFLLLMQLLKPLCTLPFSRITSQHGFRRRNAILLNVDVNGATLKTTVTQ